MALWRAVFDMNKNPLLCISIHVTRGPCQAGNRRVVTTGSTREIVFFPGGWEFYRRDVLTGIWSLLRGKLSAKSAREFSAEQKFAVYAAVSGAREVIRRNSSIRWRT